MKINDSINNVTGLGIDKAAAGKANAAKPNDNKASSVEAKPSENVTLSPMASQLKSLEEKVAASNVFDAEKVEAIKSAIAGGQFKVDSEKVADGLIASVKDFLSTQK